jgi:hypothetical protein
VRAVLQGGRSDVVVPQYAFKEAACDPVAQIVVRHPGENRDLLTKASDAVREQAARAVRAAFLRCGQSGQHPLLCRWRRGWRQPAEELHVQVVEGFEAVVKAVTPIGQHPCKIL